LKAENDETKFAARRLVLLDPATGYADRWYQYLGKLPVNFGTPAPADIFEAARRATTSDAEGRFTFSDLPAGKYFVRTELRRVWWTVS
jgi:hypothetical protein